MGDETRQRQYKSHGPGLMNTACGSVRAATPPKGGLVAKPEGTFPNQRLHDRLTLTNDGRREGGMTYLHQPCPPHLGGLVHQVRLTPHSIG
jgi:hypothetical protein